MQGLERTGYEQVRPGTQVSKACDIEKKDDLVDLHLDPSVVLRRLLATVCVSAANPGECAELMQDVHDRHLRVHDTP